jgi:outer membrane protein assembly factor BamB
MKAMHFGFWILDFGLKNTAAIARCSYHRIGCAMAGLAQFFNPKSKIQDPKLIAAVLTLAAPVFAADWPQWRGPSQTGATSEKAVVTKWTKEGENLLWKSDVGGRAAPIILNGHVYIIAPVGEAVSLRERVVCMDALTGKTLWEFAFPVYLTDIVENRVGFTALAGDTETGNVYAHGTGGELFCFDRDGKILWKKSLTEDFGRVSGYGGRIHTPIIDEDRVVISMTCSSWGEYAKPGHRYYAFDKKTGAMIWSAAPGGPPNDTSCACPIVAVIGGRRLLIAPNVDGAVYAMLARSGDTVWSYKFSKRPLNTMPVVDGNRVYITHSEENYGTTEMGAIVCLDGSKTGELDKSAELWRVNGVDLGYAAPCLANGRIYAIDNSAMLECFDAKDGRRCWQHDLGNLGKGSPVVTADGVIYAGAQSAEGDFWILKDAGDKVEELDHKLFPRTPAGLDEVLGSPAVADGKVYFQTRYATYCLGKKETLGGGLQAGMPEDKGGEGEKLAKTLIVPNEVTLAPGESVKLNLLPFTNFGRKSAEAPGAAPQWTVAGVKGKWDDATMTFTAAPDAAFSAGAVKAKWSGDVESAARIRICPKLPFKCNFDDLKPDGTPPGWLNVVNKTKIVDQNGNKVLQKLAEKPSPPFMRIRAFMCPPIAGGYTVAADIMSTSRKTPIKEFWADAGLINSRYELLLMGDTPSSPYARLVAWPPIPRVQKDVPLAWKPGVWYRVKFQVKYEGGKALLRGKVWARDEQEPKDWLIEETDPYPNLEGSPGLYGYSNGTTEKSKGAEIFYDNIEVTANE